MDEDTIFSMGELSLGDSTMSEHEHLSSVAHSTKVFYYIDDKPTPYVVEIQDAAPNEPNLGDFLKVFSFPNREFKFFCKTVDKDLGCEVKQELIDPHIPLCKSKNGHYELFLVTLQSNGTVARSSGTLPRKAVKHGDYMLVDIQGRLPIRRRRSLEALNSTFGQSMPSVSSRGTIVSRRAGETLAEIYTSNSEDPYRYDENSRVSLTDDGSLYDTVPMRPGDRRKRKPRKDHRYRKAYVPSTISSVTESSHTSLTLPQIMEVYLALDKDKYLGISVVPYNGSIIVSDITRGSVVACDGRIEIGDQIVSVNKQSLEHLTDQEAIDLLRRVAAERKPLTLFVAKRQISDSYTETLTSLTDQTLPLDIPTWVQTAAQYNAERLKAGIPFEETQSEIDRSFEATLDVETDDEEERLYFERRNGPQIPRSVLEEAERRRENERNQLLLPSTSKEVQPIRLSVRGDAMLIVRAAARPGSGLDVKNRKWLKIPVPQSFIGSDLVDWLQRNVEDIKERKEARKFAASLLEKRLIKHVVSKLTFTEKCYYVFDESVFKSPVPETTVNTTCTTTGLGRGEATTEVTYVPSPAQLGRTRALQQMTPNVQRYASKLDETDLTSSSWPFSPITVYNSNTNNGRLRDCESIVTNTNDYASMLGESVLLCAQPRNAQATARVHPTNSLTSRGAPPPNTPLSSLIGPPHPSPADTEFEDDDRRRILSSA